MKLSGVNNELGENVYWCHFVNSMSHVRWPVIQAGTSRWEATIEQPRQNEAFMKLKLVTSITFTSTMPRQEVQLYSERAVLTWRLFSVAAVAACHLVSIENIWIRQYIRTLQLSEHWSAHIVIDFTSGYIIQGILKTTPSFVDKIK